MSYGHYGFYAPKPSQAELRAKAAKAVKAGYKPVVIEGRIIARTWWGRNWCDNIDRYADNYNRLDRGKSYVRSNCVVDLNIEGGLISAKVMGSRKTPYDVQVKIAPIEKEKYEQILSICEGKLESISALENGKFPEEYKDLFTAKDKGLFPSIREIAFYCSCPDSSRVCKHIAAVLYAIGHRLDDDPLFFFSLRGINVKSFAETVIKKEAKRLWSGIDKDLSEDREMDEESAMRLFGFEKQPEGKGEIDFRKILK